VSLYGNNLGLTNESAILLEQIQTFDKMRFIRELGHLDDEMMKRIDQALACSIGLNNEKEK
jgi:mRNA interferase MazF